MFTHASWHALVAELAHHDDCVAALIRRHVANPHGHCDACASHNVPAPAWPCTLHDLAWAAAHLIRSRRGGAA